MTSIHLLKKFIIKASSLAITDRHGTIVYDADVLPLSLEDNSTIAGTLNILTEMQNHFRLPSDEPGPEYLPLDTRKMSFHLKTAREHYELLTMQKNHLIYMQEFEKQLRSREKSVEDQIIDCNDTESAQESGESVEPDTTIENKVVTLEREQRRFRESDKVFWETYNNCLAKLLDVLGTNSEEKYLALMKDLKSTNISSQRDHFKRSLLHIAVELQNDVYAKFLVDIGLNVNEKEGCGLTPEVSSH